MEKAGHKKEELESIFKGYIHDLNHHMPKYIRIADLLERSDIEFIFNNVKRMASGANTEDTRDRIFEALHSSDIEKPLDILGKFIVMY
jgi:hypothetical protein